MTALKKLLEKVWRYSRPVRLTVPQPQFNEQDLVWLDKFVIACPNEWDSMVVGRVVGFLPRSSGVLIVDDMVSGSQVIVFSPRVEYSEEALFALARMTPYERYNHISVNSTVGPDKPRTGQEPLTVEDYAEIAVRVAALQKQH